MVQPEYLPSFIGLLGAVLLFGLMTLRATSGKSLPKLRRMSIVSTLDEAVGRAAEQGRPVVVVLGGQPSNTSDAGQIMAGTSILRHVCTLAGRLKVKVIVPTRYGEMIPIVDAAMKEGYQEGGSPDLYDANTNVPFFGSEMYAWHLSSMSLIARERAAASVLIGARMGLMFTEAGSVTGTMVFAGSSDLRVIPKLVFGADYSLIGEELFATGAYCSQDPIQTATIFAQDMARLVFMGLLVVGSVVVSSGLPQLAAILSR